MGALAELGEREMRFDKIRVFFNHPGFIAANVDRVAAALKSVPESRRSVARLVFTAHSIPGAMAANCRYEVELQETCRLRNHWVRLAANCQLPLYRRDARASNDAAPNT